MSELPINFQDDILSEDMNGRRKYQMITNADGTVSFVDVTEYTQVGSNFGQAQINATNAAVNESADKNKIIDDKDDLVANSQAGMIAGALAVKAIRDELNNNLSKKTQTLSEGIVLEYNEYVAILKVNMSGRSFTGTQWNQIAIIPEEVRPKERGLYFVLIDNTVNSNATNNPVFARIDTDGKVYIYAFSDRTTLAPVGSVTYII